MWRLEGAGPASVHAADPARERSAARRARRRRGAPPLGAFREPADEISSGRRASCSRTSPGCRRSSTWRRCATPWPTSAAIQRGSTPHLPPSSSSTTPCSGRVRLARAIFRNAELEFERNRERYAFLRWGQEAFDNFKVVPPNTGIVHQVNLEFLARVVESRNGQAFPDTLVVTDSHTTMVNGLGVLGWGVGGIEAEAPRCSERRCVDADPTGGRVQAHRKLPEGATATDLVPP